MRLPRFPQGEGSRNRCPDLPLRNQPGDGTQVLAGRCHGILPGLNAVLLRQDRGWLFQQRDQRSSSPDHLHRASQRLSTSRIYHQIDPLHDLLKGRGGIVDHDFGAQRNHEVQVGLRGRRDDLYANPSGKLHRERANAAGTSVDQDALPRLQTTIFNQGRPGNQRATGDRVGEQAGTDTLSCGSYPRLLSDDFSGSTAGEMGSLLRYGTFTAYPFEKFFACRWLI
jgi:hypothetical protein